MGPVGEVPTSTSRLSGIASTADSFSVEVESSDDDVRLRRRPSCSSCSSTLPKKLASELPVSCKIGTGLKLANGPQVPFLSLLSSLDTQLKAKFYVLRPCTVKHHVGKWLSIASQFMWVIISFLLKYRCR